MNINPCALCTIDHDKNYLTRPVISTQAQVTHTLSASQRFLPETAVYDDGNTNNKLR